MDAQELLARGEDSSHQLKRQINQLNGLAAEVDAFSNDDGERIFIRIEDDSLLRDH